MTAATAATDPATGVKFHFLDVGPREYGDSVLCEVAGLSVLVDGAHPGDQVGTGGHPSIPQQLRSLLGSDSAPTVVDLLVVTHAHQDHIGCLPYLVEHGLLAARWALVADPLLGWGRAAGEAPAPPDAAPSAQLVAALREEVRTEATNDADLAQFIADAASLESQYTAMLDRLSDQGTQVVRHGRDDPGALLAHFASIGLAILGPSDDQLVACAEAISQATDAMAGRVSDALADTDEPAVEAYRRLIKIPAVDAATDALQRPGPAINLQSIVIQLEVGDVKVLLGGDMQFADPQLSHPVVHRELAALRGRIHDQAPYSLAKLSHHGSDNAFDSGVLEELGNTELFGICAGEQSTAHPNPEVLELLASKSDHLRWARTDRNGLVTFEFNGQPRVRLTRGELNDPRPNTGDWAVRAPGLQKASTPVLEVSTEGAPAAGEPVEINTRIPADVERISMTVDVKRRPGAARPPAAPETASDQMAGVVLAGGRRLPPLLFVTERRQLIANIGQQEASLALEAIRGAGQRVLELSNRDGESGLALAEVRSELANRSEISGVVLLGGYDIVPSQRLDALPPPLRARLGRTEDFDEMIIWNDDGYGDTDGDGVAELPVSRIPDAKSAGLVAACLRANNQQRPEARVGVRNVARPFADPVYALLPGARAMAVSLPTEVTTAPALGGDHVYLMLHGAYDDSTTFSGEDGFGHYPGAVDLSNIPNPAGRIAFAGCCWGALTVEQRAVDFRPGQTPAPKVADASMALSFLRRGATAFVGCTGAHYSPAPPFGYYGGPMHQAFWEEVLGGRAPAEALLRAKVRYVAGFPHGRDPGTEEAIEYKTLQQFTCLGLGW